MLWPRSIWHFISVLPANIAINRTPEQLTLSPSLLLPIVLQLDLLARLARCYISTLPPKKNTKYLSVTLVIEN